MTKSEDEKEKPKIHKVENVLVYDIEYGNGVKAIGLPLEVETLTSGKGKGKISWGGVQAEGEGTKYSKVKYHWHYISGSPLPSNEMKELDKMIGSTSGTFVASSSNATLPLLSDETLLEESLTVKCEKCTAQNPSTNKFCANCGNPLGKHESRLEYPKF